MLTRKIDGGFIIFSDESKVVLSIEEKMQDKKILMSLAGELRSEVAHEIQDELVKLTTVGVSVTVDMSGVTYISPSVQQAFLNVQKKRDAMKKGALVLQGMSDEIYEEFDKTGTSDLLMIED